MMNPTAAIATASVTSISEKPCRLDGTMNMERFIFIVDAFGLKLFGCSRIEALLVEHANAVVGIQRRLASRSPRGEVDGLQSWICQIQITLKHD